MAKQAVPGVPTSGGIMPKLIGWAVALAVLVLIVKHPADAATWVKGGFELFGALVGGIAEFFRALMA